MFKLLYYRSCPLPACTIRKIDPSPLYQLSLIQCRIVYPNFPKAIRSLSRFVYLSILYLPLISACSLHFAYHHFILKNYSQPSRFLLRWIVWSLEISGPTFIKVLWNVIHSSWDNGLLLAQTCFLRMHAKNYHDYKIE